MISTLKAKGYKGILAEHDVILSGLGKINVLCGENNSGKTSVFEALSQENTHAISKRVENIAHLESLFDGEANRWSNPSARTSKEWFSNQIRRWKEEDREWFSDQENEFVKELETLMLEPPLSRRGNGIFNFNTIFTSFLKQTLNSYKTLLIPPKRRIQTNVKLVLNEAFRENGTGILNRLFYLKNQDLESPAYKKYKKIYDLFREITELSFAIFPDSDNGLTLEYGHDGNWLLADDSGLGLSDVLVILTHVVDTDATFIFIEEPENHLHAVFQKRLLSVLNKTKNKQFFLSTHSSVFLDPVVVDKIFYTTCDEYVSVSDETSRSEMIASLGYSVAENLVSDAIILTEGPSDIRVLKTLFSWTNTLQDFNLRFWPLGGDIMAELDLSVFRESKRVFALVDNDPGSSAVRTRFIRSCDEHDIPNHRLERYSIENYVSVEALRKIFPHKISQNLKTIDPNIKVDDQVRLKKSVKSKIHEVFEIMNQEELKETDLWGFVKMVDETLRKENKTVETEGE